MEDASSLKDQAIVYFQKNQVPLRMQDALNSLFRIHPPDVNGFVSNYFDELSLKPTISKVTGTSSIDSKGQPAILVKIFCTVRNREICVGESRISVDTSLAESCKAEDKEAEDAWRETEIQKAIQLINEDFQSMLLSADPCSQHALDQLLYNGIEQRRADALKQQNEDAADCSSPTLANEESKKSVKKSGKGSSAKKKVPQAVIIPDSPKELLYPGSHAVTALSQAMCAAGASVARLPKYEHLIASFGGDSDSTKLPLPVITIIQGGKSGTGKSKAVKEYMIIPRESMPLSEAVTAATKTQELITRAASAKGGVTVKYLTDTGAVAPAVDKLEQGLDTITDALSQQGYEIGKDFFFILNASAHEYFDYEKGKYEVMTGALKAPEDMADYWADVCNRYPSIIGIIDPVRSEEKEQWNKICSSISSRCLVICNRGYSRPALLKEETLDYHQFATSGVVLALEGCNTISDVVECAKKMADGDNVIMLASGQHDTNDTTVVDVAIACQARFVKLGAVARGERVAKYCRLVDLENDLGDRKKEWEALEFPAIPPKPITPEPESVQPGAEIVPQGEAN